MFCAWERLSGQDEEPRVDDVLQEGRHLVMAGYAVYGPSTLLVLSSGAGVAQYSLHPDTGEFVRADKLVLPGNNARYSVDEGGSGEWAAGLREFLRRRKEGGAAVARYTGALASDLHGLMVAGGVFMKPEGTLKLLSQAVPAAYLVEQGGGGPWIRLAGIF